MSIKTARGTRMNARSRKTVTRQQQMKRREMIVYFSSRIGAILLIIAVINVIGICGAIEAGAPIDIISFGKAVLVGIIGYWAVFLPARLFGMEEEE